MKAKLYVLFILFLSQIIFGQGGALSFMTLQQSPQFMGAAQIGVAVPPVDPLGFYLNPAVLGESSKEFNATVVFYPSKVDWLDFGNLDYNTWGFSLGYNFEDLIGLPLSLGFGVIKNKIDYGKFGLSSVESPELIFHTDSYDDFTSYSFGVGYEYYLQFSAGVSFKNYDSKMAGRITAGELETITADGNAFDYGFLVTAPISKLFYPNVKIHMKDDLYLKPKTNISLGYSLTNIGDEVEYSSLEDQKDPLSRTARLGYNINLGFDLYGNDYVFNLFDYYFLTEAQDILIEKKEESNYVTKYQSGLGDIKFGSHLINLEADENVIVRKAHMFRFLETVSYSVGRYDGHGFHDVMKTDGLTISSTGISKYLAANFENDIIQFIAKHISLEYYNTTIFKDFRDTDIEGIGIILKNFSF